MARAVNDDWRERVLEAKRPHAPSAAPWRDLTAPRLTNAIPEHDGSQAHPQPPNTPKELTTWPS
jgi:hypothetical protein